MAEIKQFCRLETEFVLLFYFDCAGKVLSNAKNTHRSGLKNIGSQIIGNANADYVIMAA